LARQGHREEAIQHFREALRIDPAARRRQTSREPWRPVVEG
jgi:hypothetical protein